MARDTQLTGLHVFLLLLSFLLLISSPAAASISQVYTFDLPPYNYQENKQIKGFSSQIMREMLIRQGYSDTITMSSWLKGLEQVQQQPNSLIFSAPKTPQTEDKFKWVGPLVPSRLAIFALKSTRQKISQLEQAKAVDKIGICEYSFARQVLQKAGFNNTITAKNKVDNLEKLLKGKIDLWAVNELAANYLIKKYKLELKIEKIYDIPQDHNLYIAFNNNTPDDEINRWQQTLDEMKSDGSYAQIFSHGMAEVFLEPESQASQQIIELTKAEKAWIKAHPIIRVSPDPDYPPLQFKDERGQIKGLASDYLDIISQKLGLKFVMIESDSWQQTLENLEQRKADLVAFAAPNKERSRYLNFSPITIEYPDVIISRKNTPSISSLVELHNKRLGTIKGYAINAYLRQYYPHIKLVYKPTVSSLLKAVSVGEVDATVLGVAASSYMIEKDNITNLSLDAETGFVYKLTVGSRNDWPMLNQLISKALNSIDKKQRQQLFRRWISVSDQLNQDKNEVEELNLSQEEIKWLSDNPIINVAARPDWEPIEYLDQNHKYSGLTADFLSLIEEKLGIKFQALHMNNAEHAKQVLLEQKAHVWASAMPQSATTLPPSDTRFLASNQNPSLDAQLLYTPAFLKLRSVIVVKKKVKGHLRINDLLGKPVLAVKDSAIYHYLIEQYPELQVQTTTNSVSGLNMVAQNKAYAFIGDIASISYAITNELLVNLRIAGNVDFVLNISLASHQDAPLLNSILSKAIRAIEPEEIQAILAGWINLTKEPWRPSKEFWLVLTLVSVLFFIVAIIIWNRMLSAQVRSRTDELNRSLETSEHLRELWFTAHQEAKEANKVKSKFFAAASHDLRQPLHALGLLVSSLEQNYQKDKERDNVIFNMINKSLLNQKELFNSLLDSTKLDAGTIQPKPAHFKVKQLAQELNNEFAMLAKDKKLSFDIDVDANLVAYSDELIVKRILRNLLSNAISYTSSGSIHLQIKEQQQVQFCVHDSGPGIPEDEQKNIFNEFYQIESISQKSANKGLGLGLSIVARLSKLLNSQISLESAIGKGSSFCFNLPLGKPEEISAAAEVKAINAQWNFKQSKILLIDDDLEILDAMRYQLESWQCEVMTYSNHHDCIKFLSHNNFQPDLIILDYRLTGGVRGTQIIDDLVACMHDKPNIIFISAESSQEKLEAIKLAGYQCLHKPVRPALLRLTLQKYLNKSAPMVN